MSPFAPDSTVASHRSLHRSLGVLAVLGLLHMRGEWRDTLAVWGYGRSVGEAARPWWLLDGATLAAMLFALGIAWRASGLAMGVLMAMAYVVAPVTYHNNLYLLALLVMLTALFARHEGSPWQRGDGERAVSGVYERLAQWQLALAYVRSVLVKATHPLWQGTGGVIRWLAVVRVPETRGGMLNAWLSPLLAHHGIAAALDVVVEVGEVAIPVMLASPRWRRMGLVAGVVLHGFLQAWLHPQLFTFLMLWGYFAYVPAGDRAWTLTWNVRSPLQRRLAAWWPRIDWRARIALREGDASALDDGRGGRWQGFGAWVMAAVLSPVSLLAVATLCLLAPTITRVGPWSRDGVEQVMLGALAVISAATLVQRTLVWERSPDPRTAL